jgi:hypothetical protein
LAIVHLERRRLIWTNVTTNPTAEWIARQITEAFPWDQMPRYLIRDRDGSYGVMVERRIRAMGIRDRPTAPRSPWQNGHIERLHRLHPPRMPGSRRGPGRSASSPDPQRLRRLLQSHPYSSCSREGRPAQPSRPRDWTSRGHPSPRRPASPIRPDGLIGRDTPSKG